MSLICPLGALFYTDLPLSPKMIDRHYMEHGWVAMAEGKKALASKYFEPEVMHMPSIHNSLARNNHMAPSKHKWTRNFTPDPRKPSAKYLKMNTHDFRITAAVYMHVCIYIQI